MALLAAAALLSIVLGVAVGSVYIPPGDILAVLASRLTGAAVPERVGAVVPAMVTDMRLPRVLLAFLTGAALAGAGTVMQSALQNPLASPFGLGVSSGAGLGAAIVIVTGLASGAGRMFALLVGMVASLFFNAVMNMLATLSPAYAQRIDLWLLGSFSMREWPSVWVLLPVTALVLGYFQRYARELDVMSFGEEQAQVLGVDLRRARTRLIAAVAALTGTAVAFVGVIGFVDLVAPHMARRFFGASHSRVLPASALLGGTLLVLCDLAARTVMPPREIPIGSITALIGAPFFLYVYFAGRGRRGP